jgi:hypothetical protein
MIGKLFDYNNPHPIKHFLSYISIILTNSVDIIQYII